MVNGWSRVDGGLIDQHHRNVVLDRIRPPARVAAKTRAVLDEANRGLAHGTHEDIEQGLINGHDGNIRGKASRNPTRQSGYATIGVGSVMPAALVLAGAIFLQAPAPAQPPDPVGEAYFLFLQSRRLEDDGKVPEAIAALRRAITLVPKAAEIHAELAGVFAREGRAAESVTAAEAALALEPRNREANRTLAFVKAAVASDPAYASSAASMKAEAIRHLELSLSDSVVDLSAQLLLAKLYSQTGQHQKALSAIKNFLTEQPGYPEALLLMGESAE